MVSHEQNVIKFLKTFPCKSNGQVRFIDGLKAFLVSQEGYDLLQQYGKPFDVQSSDLMVPKKYFATAIPDNKYHDAVWWSRIGGKPFPVGTLPEVTESKTESRDACGMDRDDIEDTKNVELLQEPNLLCENALPKPNI